MTNAVLARYQELATTHPVASVRKMARRLTRRELAAQLRFATQRGCQWEADAYADAIRLGHYDQEG